MKASPRMVAWGKKYLPEIKDWSTDYVLRA